MKIGPNGNLVDNKSRVALLKDKCEEGTKNDLLVKNLDLKETRCTLLANLMVSTGVKGKVCLQLYFFS